MRIVVRPAEAADAEQSASGHLGWATQGVLADRWREGDNRRSFVAVAIEETADGSAVGGDVVGHCRGIDNVFHPASRTLVIEVREDMRGRGIGTALLEAQRDVSTVPLHLKVGERNAPLRELARRAGAVAIQAMPPWRYVVGDAMRAWAGEAGRSAGPRTIRDDERGRVAELETDHYIAQHAGWSPTAEKPVLLAEFSADHEPGSESGYDVSRSVVLERDGMFAAAALVWPEEDHHGQRGCEVTLLAEPYEGPDARADKEACLAAVIDRCADGDLLMIDSHLTERVEQEMMRGLPGLDDDSGWMAILAVPVDGQVAEAAPIVLPADLVPEEAAWVREHIPESASGR